jgi:hypothetical protein
VVLAVVVVAAVLLATAGTGPRAPTQGVARPTPATPWLTRAEKAQAARILAADPRAKALFGGAAYAIAEIAPWTTIDQRKIGAEMIVDLETPRSFPVVEWPAVQSDWSLPFPHYRERTLPASAARIRDFDVFVDLNRDRLVALRPRNAEKMKMAPWMAPWPPPSGD